MQNPKLRPVEAIATQDGLVCLRDPQGFSDQLVFLPQEALFVVSLFDGRHTIRDVQYEFSRRFGTILPSEKVEQIVAQLDGCLFLDSERFREARERTVEEFRQAPARPASHAGSAYPAEPGELRGELQALLARPAESPGLDSPAAPSPTNPSGALRGLIAPHIDPRRGGHCYAAGYGELERAGEAETFVVLGIAHVPMRRRFALCGKDFETPLGTLPLDREFSENLERRLRGDFREDEFVHRTEHSVEFQALFLQYLYGGRKAVRLVPILCGGFEKASVSGLPEDEAEVKEFLEALAEILGERGPSACCIAAVDLSHLGRRFGQELTLSPSALERAEAEDRRMIDRVLAGDAEGFFRLIQEERDRRNVCGVPAIYSLLRLLQATGNGDPPARPGRLLCYQQAVEEATDSLVTFMSAAFYG
ncbi:MAG: AmmeMemoRadiSam system protein B [Spirochaetales bacterium]|nr:AmmeMemoRadiSam system protein B [Spirochaetales bacterium]